MGHVVSWHLCNFLAHMFRRPGEGVAEEGWQDFPFFLSFLTESFFLFLSFFPSETFSILLVPVCWFVAFLPWSSRRQGHKIAATAASFCLTRTCVTPSFPLYPVWLHLAIAPLFLFLVIYFSPTLLTLPHVICFVSALRNSPILLRSSFVPWYFYYYYFSRNSLFCSAVSLEKFNFYFFVVFVVVFFYLASLLHISVCVCVC